MKRGGTPVLTLGLGGLAVLVLLPLYVVIVTAFKPGTEILGASMLAAPTHWTWAPLARAWSSACIGAACDGLAGGVWNAVRITVPAVCLSVGLGAVNGYALTRWRVPGAHLLFAVMLAANFLPYQVVLLPMALVLRAIGLFGTVKGLILVHVVYGMPYTTLLFRNFFRDLPDDVIRAARMDGAGFWRIFRHVVLPMSVPMLAVAAVLQFTGVWNDYLFGLVFGGRHVPVTVLLNNLVNSQSGQPEYNVNMAGVLLATVPTLLCYLFAGRWFLRGFAAGAASR
jgi:glucose/mannose transport system permease protein